MKQLEKILFATDFTKASDNALQMAISIAKTFGSEIIVTHVMPRRLFSKAASEKVRQIAENNLKKSEEEITKKNIKLGDIRLVTGNPFDQIIKHADFYNVNLIIMGSGENENGDQFKLGINAHKVIRRSIKPVLVVKNDATSQIKNILCSVDLSSTSRRALENAIHLARNLGATLNVLSVIEPTQTDYTGIAIMPYEEEETHSKYEENQFNKLLQDLDFNNIKWEKEIRRGKPYKEIIKAAVDKKADLLIMGTIGIDSPTSVLIGSVTEKVIREVPCSLITMKTEDAIRLRLEADLKNIEECFKEGKELMEKGFNKEALTQFENCLNIDLYFEPAWECLAIVYERLGKKEQAENSRKQAKLLRERLWERKVEAEIRSRHTILGRPIQQ